jgi:iron complex outermembrane receptor protein
VEAERARLTDTAGVARFADVRGARVTVAVRRLGYAPLARPLDLVRRRAGDTLQLALVPSAMSLADVVVTGTAGTRRADEVFQPTTVLDGAALDRALGTSIAATLAGEPGITQRTNGPVATAPIIRGLGGDRVLVLEDGLRMGDVSTTAPDHAIAADPISARRIEVVRGPAGLLYGSNTLGGVVNVVREDVPHARPERTEGVVSMQGESATTGGTVAGSVTAPLGPFALRAEGSWRDARDSRTAGGVLPFTDQRQHDAALGLAWVGARGHAGLAVRDFRSDYGVPTSIGSLVLPGAHVGGIYIDLRRTMVRGDAEWRPAGGAITSVRASGNWVRFAQDEVERGGFVGTRFGQLSSQGDVVLRYRRARWLPGQGAIGVFGQWRDLRATGSFTGTRPAIARTVAAYAYEELAFGPLRIMGGARHDVVRLEPLERTPTQLLPDVRDRAFSAWSGSVAATLALPGAITVGASVARAFRPPAIEELYSAGPHLASFAYEIGNPALEAERGVGGDLFVRVARRTVQAEASVFRTRVDGFIQYAPLVDARTGLPQRDPRLRRYVVYQATQAPALLEGAEGRVQVEPVRGWVADGTVSWVRGTRTDLAQPLPAMPPLRARLQLRRETPRWLLGVGADAIGAQRRIPAAPTGAGATCDVARGVEDEATVLPAEFCATDGAVLLNATAGLRRTWGGRLHALTLVLDNAADALWRDHLWRAKQVAPQPGRNVRLLYRVSF